MIDVHRIVFNGLSSDEFNVTLHYSFEDDNGSTSSFLSQSNIYTEHYDGHRIIHRSKYNAVFTPRFTLIKNDFSDFDADENRKILSWLTASDKPGWLEVYRDDSNVMDWQCCGSIINLDQYKMGNGRVIGYEFDIETTHPYAFSRKMEITKKISGSTPISITCNSDEYNKPLYPKVTITFGNDIYIEVDKYPLSNTYTMMPNTIYLYNGAYYINIPDLPYKGEVSMDILTTPSGASPGVYYCIDGKTIVRRAVVDNSLTDQWETVAEVGASVKIDNTYILDGTPIDKSSIVTGAAPKETIVLDGTNKIISTSDDKKTIIGDYFNFVWVPLVAGDNELTITGNGQVKIEWIEPRKVGDL